MKPAKKKQFIAAFSLVLGIIFLFMVFRDSVSLGVSNALHFLQTYRMFSTPPGNLLTREAISNSPTKPTSTSWLASLNEVRSKSGLPRVAENANWNLACEQHSRYMVKNDTIAHDEDQDNLWYTPEGAAAARNSNVMVSSDTRSPDEDAISLWLSQPFHGIGILDPQLETVGFGSYREAVGTWKMAATLDVASGNTTTEPPNSLYPVMWPPEGQATSILSYDGTEWPDPLRSCPGYKAPSGPPIYLQIGKGSLTPDVRATSFREDGEEQKHCVFDETSYFNPDANREQEIGRGSLNSRDAIILMPEQPLKPGATYTVSITTNNHIYTWSFTAER